MKKTNQSVEDFLKDVDSKRLPDIITLIELGRKLTKKEPFMWGSIIGFGSLHYTYKTGLEGDMPLLGIANRKQAITLYVSFDLEHYPQRASLGKHNIGKGCLYIKKVSDIDLNVLESLIKEAMQDTLALSIITDNES